jgi:hypothetical protein
MDLCEIPNFDQFTVLMIQEKILSTSGQWHGNLLAYQTCNFRYSYNYKQEAQLLLGWPTLAPNQSSRFLIS